MAYVLTSISGNLISAASAGYAPTNSADVSAIASAYQVVSSTSTQLYAGTAFLTEVNGAPVSASRAGNAANAGMANSAYYDGTGRLISSLPDSAAVSSIASSYAESAASGKLDSSASSSFYTVDNPSGFITGVDLGEYATTGYVDSAVSGKADSSALSSYALSSDVSGIIDTVSTNSASWGGGVDSATVSAIASSYVESGVSGKMDSSAMTSYALSADVSGTVDLVSTQSANWGGSALALSAGPGVKLEKVGDTLVASTDETVLWSGACLTQGGAAAALSEAASNFDKIEIYALPNPSTSFEFPQCFTYPGNNTAGAYMCSFMTTGLKGKFSYGRWTITNGTSFNLTDAGQTDTYPAFNFDNSYGGVVKVVGINRTAEA